MKVVVSDLTLRDGNHAVRHQVSLEQIREYTTCAEIAGIPVVEVGHGNGIGASSLQVGLAKESDRDIIQTARACLKKSKLCIHAMPGFATIDRDLAPAIEMGVDIIRVASHCTEADITERHIRYCREQGKTVYGVLMMSHMTSESGLLEQAKKLQDYGALGVFVYDSAGYYLPDDVKNRISVLVDGLSIEVGFHAHNNLGMAVANSIAALSAGATMLDACAKGFGAGAGNAQIEVLVPVLHRLGYSTGIDLYKVLDLSEVINAMFPQNLPEINAVSIVSGLAGVFSGFKKHVEKISKQFSIDPKDVFFECGKRQLVGGQEDIIIEIAAELSRRNA